MPFISNSDEDRRAMLDALGAKDINDLVSGIPKECLLTEDWKQSPGKSEQAVYKYLSSVAQRNEWGYISFLGGGSYDHFIPAAVNTIAGRSEFITAYTPYQAEVSQGTLQAIYEYQTMICELTGMDVSNASMYCGVTSTAEAVLLATSHTERKKILIAGNLPVNYQILIKTYCHGRGIVIEKVPCPEGIIDQGALKRQMDTTAAGLVVQYPNYYGLIEPIARLSEIVHSAGGLMITAVNPVALGVLRTPGSSGVDIVTGEGQVLGNEMSWGGPYVGILAVKEALIRKIPGRLSGMTIDTNGKRGFVLTLQTREQHIRRAKATSNICSNEGLIALRSCVYMSLLGKEGIREVALQCLQKAHYLADAIAKVPGYSLKYNKPFFNEFVVKCPKPAQVIYEKMQAYKLFAGIPLADMGDPNDLLVAVTEQRTKQEMDLYVEKLKSL